MRRARLWCCVGWLVLRGKRKCKGCYVERVSVKEREDTEEEMNGSEGAKKKEKQLVSSMKTRGTIWT